MKVVHKKSKETISQTNTRAGDNSKEIDILIDSFCSEYLNDTYLELCLKLKNDYEKIKPKVFNRGSVNNWGAAFVWAIVYMNTANESFEFPFLDLKLVCDYFGTKKSTVGQKAGKIRKDIDLSLYYDDYITYDEFLQDFLSIFSSLAFLEDEEDIFEIDDDIEEILDINLTVKYSTNLGKSEMRQIKYILDQKSKEFIERDGVDREIGIEKSKGNLITVFAIGTIKDMREIMKLMKDYGFNIL